MRKHSRGANTIPWEREGERDCYRTCVLPYLLATPHDTVTPSFFPWARHISHHIFRPSLCECGTNFRVELFSWVRPFITLSPTSQVCFCRETAGGTVLGSSLSAERGLLVLPYPCDSSMIVLWSKSNTSISTMLYWTATKALFACFSSTCFLTVHFISLRFEQFLTTYVQLFNDSKLSTFSI